MNKKRFLIFITVVGLIIAAIAMVFFRKQHKDEPVIAVEESVEGVRFFYYRSIPGLKRAEEAGLVTPIHKTYAIPEKPYELKIDRIWYTPKNIYVFYHVENIDTIAYLGGCFYFEYQEPEKLPKYDPQESVGRPSEKGVIFNNGFYSCMASSTPGDMKEDTAVLYFKPFLQINGTEYTFEPLYIEREQWTKEEPVEEFGLDVSIEIDGDILEFYALDAGVSYGKIYFSYNNPNSHTVYGLEGNIETDKGERIEVSTMPYSILEKPGHYYVEIPPFNTIPTSLKFHIQSIDIIGTDSIVGEIDTGLTKKTKNSMAIQTELGSIKNTTIILDRLITTDDSVIVEIAYNDEIELNKPYSRLKVELPFLEQQEIMLNKIQNIYNPLPNIVSIKNNFNKSPNIYNISNAGSEVWVSHSEKDRVSVSIPRSFWEASDKIYIELKNLTYQHHFDQPIRLELLNK